MHYLTIIFIVWALAASVLLVLLAYRSTLTRYEEDCLFLVFPTGKLAGRVHRSDSVVEAARMFLNLRQG